MKLHTTALSTAATFAMLASGTAVAAPQIQPPRPMFARGIGLRATVVKPTGLPTWTFKFRYQGHNFSDVFIGTDPSTGTSTTIPVTLIPIKVVYGKTSFSPSFVLPNGKTVTQTSVDSPVFQSSIDYVQGGTDIGQTQFVDAFQRASFWNTVSSHPGYHVLLGKPTVEPLQTFNVPAGFGAVDSPFGTKVIGVDIAWFDNQLQVLLNSLHIPANSLPIFLTTETYLTQGGGCCIGGYHNYNGTQAYSHFTYIQHAGDFAQDVSALSHEVSEWLDDPFINNTGLPCAGGINGTALYEVGDPLEGQANYGSTPYTINGFTYNLQDEATPPYFGAAGKTTVNHWKSFQGAKLLVCEYGQ